MPSLQDRLDHAGGAVALLRGNPADHAPFPYPPEWSTWASEQRAWRDTALLFDQTTHQDDTFVTGPDARRLISETGINTPSTLGRNRAKQFVAVGPDGNFIGDGILFGWEDDSYELVGVPFAGDWIEYQAAQGGYDVEIERRPPLVYNRVGGMKLWRYQLNGPATQAIVDRVAGRDVERIPFFRMGEFHIAGTPVRALNHTMSGVPGDDYTGLELFGPIEHADRVLDALMEAGRDFGLQRGGAMSYLSTDIESGGWIPLPVPAIYSHPDLRAYRTALPGFSLAGLLPLEGSLVSDRIEDYYASPWDLGYGRLIRFDHEFIGRSALEARRDEPHRTRVWLRWNRDDVVRIIRDGLFGEEGTRPRVLSLPTTVPMAAQYDEVRQDDEIVGVSMIAGYTVNIQDYFSLALVDAGTAVDGQAVTITWGDPDSGTRPFMQPGSAQTTIRATVVTAPPRRP